jgi:digeranylgeranylglycerophospholipid reductase
MINEYEVIVIGAGPAGSTTARILSNSGYNVLLIEKDEFPGQTNVCACGFPLSVLKDLNVPENVIEKKILGAKHYFPWGLREESYRKNLQATSYRRVFDQFLASKAKKCGTELLCSTLATDVVNKHGALLIKTEDLNTKKLKTIQSKIVIFADGPFSLANRKFGLGFKPETEKIYVSAECEVEWKENSINKYEFYYDNKISPWGYGWLFPRNHTVNIGLGCLNTKVKNNIYENFLYFLNKYPIIENKIKNKNLTWFGSALIPAAPAKKIFGQSMLVVGDAAGMVDPIHGGGIANSIEGGKIGKKQIFIKRYCFVIIYQTSFCI